jgi:excinuclease ABC subunit C
MRPLLSNPWAAVHLKDNVGRTASSTDPGTMAFDIRAFSRTLTSRPGVYRMLDEAGAVLYVGKAGNLRRRVASYSRQAAESPKVLAMLRQVRAMEVTVTRTEGEALLLESNLIKEYRPRYNVVFRDDKSYPYLYLSSEHDFPRLSFYRGARSGRGRYFGPFPGAGAARQTLNLTQKLFHLRQCEDAFFRGRSRPCLQFQIGRCSAPCVDRITREDYRRDVDHAVMFLEGRNEEVIEALTGPMQAAARTLDFERAARYRDQIASLRRIQEQQHITAPAGECDIVACAATPTQACVQVFYVRGGRNLGNNTYFPRHAPDTPAPDILGAFLQQHYVTGKEEGGLPPEILVSHRPPDRELLESVLAQGRSSPVRIRDRVRGWRARWLALARDNAELALARHIASRQKFDRRLEALREGLKLDEVPQRIECFDISHTRGEAPVAACVVFGAEGPIKTDYRRFNIEGLTPGDDYAALAQAAERRYGRMIREEGRLPDVIFIDGGKGQVGAVRAVLAELQLQHIPVIGVAKGASRRPGLETLVASDGRREFRWAADSPALHLVQEIRDEAHRFAVAGHRGRRARRRSSSPLERIEGVGSKRRQQLLRHFGGMQGIERAGIEELANVPGINKNLARRIYDVVHGSS